MVKKSDLSVFSTYYLGLILGISGVLLGLIFLFSEKKGLGLFIIIISMFIGKFLVFKSKRRY